MISKKKVEGLINEKLQEDDYFVVSLDISAGNKIRLIIDSMQGITIEEIVAFSRAIEHNLDRDTEDFELEVTSPGLSLPLMVKKQYVKNIGRELDILLNDNKRLKGELKEVLDESILIEEKKRVKIEGKKKKQLITEQHSIAFTDINTAKIVLKF